jgi:hypothetical protein
MATIIKIVERSTGEPDEADGKYIESFDPLWNENSLGVGHLVVTEDDKKALVFEDAKRALEFWKQQSPTHKAGRQTESSTYGIYRRP